MALILIAPIFFIASPGISGIPAAFVAVISALLLMALARVFTDPTALGFEINETSRISEDAIAILSCLAKVPCVLMPGYIAAVNVLGVLGILVADVVTLILIGSTTGAQNEWFILAQTISAPSLSLLVGGAFIAFTFYLESVLVLLFLDVLEAIFRGVRYLGELSSSD